MIIRVVQDAGFVAGGFWKGRVYQHCKIRFKEITRLQWPVKGKLPKWEFIIV